jgi:hypothetical protein
METSAHVAGLEQNATDLLQDAAAIVRSATDVGRAITADEDSVCWNSQRTPASLKRDCFVCGDTTTNSQKHACNAECR